MKNVVFSLVGPILLFDLLIILANIYIDAKTESEVSTSIADKSNQHFKDSGLEVGLQKNPDLRGDSNHPLHHKQQQNTRHCVKRMEKSSLIVVNAYIIIYNNMHSLSRLIWKSILSSEIN